jgi:glutaredoxin 3
MSIVIYTTKICPYCVQAKRLFNQLAVPFREISVEGDEEAFLKMCQASGRRTVPQIWIGETHVGGCDDLYALHRSGELRALLSQNGFTISP